MENGISEELKSMGSALAGYSRSMPYAVPAGYFDGFAANTSQLIKDISAPEVIPTWPRTMPYAVPANYFAELPAQVTTMVTYADSLPTTSKSLPNSVPAGYFDALPAQILAAAKATEPIVEQKKGRVIPFKFKRRTSRSPIRWAAAAVMLICIGLGSYETIYNGGQPSHEKMLSSISSTDIHDYLQHTYRLDVDRVVTNNDISALNVDAKDIVEYLNETGWDQTE